MILFSHPLSTPFTREAALALAEAGWLAEVRTCLHWTPGGIGDAVLPGSVAKELGRRSYPVAVRERVRTTPWRETGRLLAARVPKLGFLARHETGICSVDAVFHALDRVTARRAAELARSGGLRGVYAYEDGALATFAAAERLGLKAIYDLPIGYWRAAQRIFAEEAERVPAWAATLAGRNDSPQKLARKDAEIGAADTVVVASSFTRRTLEEAPTLRGPVHVVPYGAPEVVAVERAEGERRKPSGALRVMFAGSLGQRKGLSYLLEAAAKLGKVVELTLLGLPITPDCAPLNAALRAHRWVPSLPHAGVLEEMERHDVLVFPSLFEGFGLVLLEAMSRGMTVITTVHTAGPDFLEEGVDGFIVPIRSSEAIAEKLELLAREPERCRAMGEAARRKAAACSWAAYRGGLVEAVRRVVEEDEG